MDHSADVRKNVALLKCFSYCAFVIVCLRMKHFCRILLLWRQWQGSTLWFKKVFQKVLSWLSKILIDFSVFTGTLSSKSAIVITYQITPHLKCVGALPCKILQAFECKVIYWSVYSVVDI